MWIWWNHCRLFTIKNERKKDVIPFPLTVAPALNHRGNEVIWRVQKSSIYHQGCLLRPYTKQPPLPERPWISGSGTSGGLARWAAFLPHDYKILHFFLSASKKYVIIFTLLFFSHIILCSFWGVIKTVINVMCPVRLAFRYRNDRDTLDCKVWWFLQGLNAGERCATESGENKRRQVIHVSVIDASFYFHRG